MKVYEMAGNELRDSRFEILRICSMVCIILGHYSWHGGVYFAGNEINKVIAGVFVFGSQLGVILFVIISAWFMEEQKQEFRVGGLIRIGCKTMIYTFICYLLYCVCNGWPASIKNMLVQFIQMVEGYWFVIVYIGFMVLVPYLNTLIDELERDRLGKLCAILLTLFCVLPTVFGSVESYILKLSCFVMVYVVTVYLKRYRKRWKVKNCVLLLVISLAFIVASEALLGKYALEYRGYFSAKSNTIPVILSAFCVFELALHLRAFSNRLVNAVAASMLGVYLLHDNSLMRVYLWMGLGCGKFFQSPGMVLHAVVCFVIVMSVGVGLDKIYHFFESLYDILKT